MVTPSRPTLPTRVFVDYSKNYAYIVLFAISLILSSFSIIGSFNIADFGALNSVGMTGSIIWFSLSSVLIFKEILIKRKNDNYNTIINQTKTLQVGENVDDLKAKSSQPAQTISDTSQMRQISALKDELAQLKKTQAEKDTLIASQTLQFTIQTKQITTLTKENEDKAQRILTIETEMNRLQTILTEQKETNQKLILEIQNIRQENEQNVHRILKMTQEKEDLQTKHHNQTKRIGDLEATIYSLEIVKTVSEKNLIAKNLEYLNKEAELKKLTIEYENCKAKLRELTLSTSSFTGSSSSSHSSDTRSPAIRGTGTTSAHSATPAPSLGSSSSTSSSSHSAFSSATTFSSSSAHSATPAPSLGSSSSTSSSSHSAFSSATTFSSSSAHSATPAPSLGSSSSASSSSHSAFSSAPTFSSSSTYYETPAAMSEHSSCSSSSGLSSSFTLLTAPLTSSLTLTTRDLPWIPILTMHFKTITSYDSFKIEWEKFEELRFLHFLFDDENQLLYFEESPYTLMWYLKSNSSLLKYFFIDPEDTKCDTANWIFHPDSQTSSRHPDVEGKVRSWVHNLDRLTSLSSSRFIVSTIPAAKYTLPAQPSITRDHNSALLGWMKTIFETTGKRGIIIGESHTHKIARQLLLDNLAYFHNIGVTTIGLEGLFYDVYQTEMDNFFRTGEMSKRLRASLITDDFAFQLLVQTQKHGIRLLAIDTTTSFNARQDRYASYRQCEMNLSTQLIIKHEIKSSDRYLILAGRAHINTCRELRFTTAVLGLGDLLEQPTLAVDEASTPSLEFNVDQFAFIEGKAILYNLDAVFKMPRPIPAPTSSTTTPIPVPPTPSLSSTPLSSSAAAAAQTSASTSPAPALTLSPFITPIPVPAKVSSTY